MRITNLNASISQGPLSSNDQVTVEQRSELMPPYSGNEIEKGVRKHKIGDRFQFIGFWGSLVSILEVYFESDPTVCDQRGFEPNNCHLFMIEYSIYRSSGSLNSILHVIFASNVQDND